jgi:signal recognition particle receptor subunit beta
MIAESSSRVSTHEWLGPGRILWRGPLWLVLAVAMIDLVGHEIVAKIVYYGPGESGKTTTLRALHDLTPKQQQAELQSIESQNGRTLLFDYLPIDVGHVGSFFVRFQIYSVAGDEASLDARKAVLSGADGVVFVADSQPHRTSENLLSLQELQKSLEFLRKPLSDFPLVIQYNKLDLVDEVTLDELRRALNPDRLPEVFSSATDRRGVVDSLSVIARLVTRSL